MRILVTGSSGSIGAAVAARLRQDAEVAGLDLLPGPETTQIGDILDTELVGRMLRDVSAVVHTAALHVPHLARSTDADFLRVNQEGTRVLLQAAAARGVGRFVYTSTTSVYGCSERVGPPATWADESLPPQPADAYDRTKLAAEALCRDAADHRMTTVILRMSRCFPEPDHLVAFYRMYRGVDRRDVAEAHYHAVVAQVPGSVTVNVSAATPFRPADLAVLWNDPWHVIDRHLPGVRAAFEQRRWPLPSRVDRVYPVSNAARVLGSRRASVSSGSSDAEADEGAGSAGLGDRRPPMLPPTERAGHQWPAPEDPRNAEVSCSATAPSCRSVRYCPGPRGPGTARHTGRS